MQNKKNINRIISSELVSLGSDVINQALPIRGINNIDPFLLIHHGSLKVPKGLKSKDLGVPPHPHRGFSPVTFIYSGSLTHRDSIGNTAEVYAGGTQWMHAGSGIVHSERPGEYNEATNGENEFIQFWVNTPAEHKMDAPFYKPISAEETPLIIKPKAKISVVAGEYEGVNGVAPTITPQTLLRIEVQETADINLSIPEDYNCLIYILNGELLVNGKEAYAKQMVEFSNSGVEINIQAKTDSRFILLSGEPINEPIASYGPFVMNTQEEIMQAFHDNQIGKMGELVEDFTNV